ncbi:MAG: flagellar basal-body rod protein FlgG [Burkholderiales bacterium]|nr:flagellar basal-body rod protein FlgG [Burkholderiales bacterium]
MNNSLYIAATGMQAQQLGLDTIANNLTNLNTPAYKTSTVNFQEMMYADPAGPHLPETDNDAVVSANPYGEGVAVASVSKDFTPGTLTQTGSPMDLAIQGNGFLEVSLPDGTHAYTRGGTLRVSKDNFLLSPQGHELKPSIRLPLNPTGISIAADGVVTATTAASPQGIQVGQIELASFSNPGALKPLGDGNYQPTDASGKPVYSKPGEVGTGLLAQGSLEGSNVNMVNQMVALMVAQRAYELSSKVIQTSDELMSLTNNLRR